MAARHGTAIPTFEEIAGFVCEETGYRSNLAISTTLQSDIGVFGDDMDELLTAFSDRFRVDMAGYLWFFHTGEEGQNFGALFFTPPYRRVTEIPITIGMLHEYAILPRQQNLWVSSGSGSAPRL